MDEKRRYSKSEIDLAIKDKDEFLQISYLNRALEKVDSFELKKYILITLAEICEKKGLLKDAAKNLSRAADITLTYREKIDLFLKEMEIGIRLKDFDLADKAMKKALYHANMDEKPKIKVRYYESFKKIADDEEIIGRARNSVRIYEKYMHLVEDRNEKIIAMQRLSDLYDKLGMIRESNAMRDKVLGQNRY